MLISLLLIPLLLITLLTIPRSQQLLEILLTIVSAKEEITKKLCSLYILLPEVLHHHPGGPDHVVHHLPALARHLAQERCPHL